MIYVESPSNPLLRCIDLGAIAALGCDRGVLTVIQLERGLKTLALRVRQHNENAGRLARYLEAHPAVACVNYPGLLDHPDHAVAARQMRGFGGMLSFELREPGRVDALLSRLRVVLPALSLGGVESLVCVPSQTSHRKLSPVEREQGGISDGLVRVSVGVAPVSGQGRPHRGPDGTGCPLGQEEPARAHDSSPPQPPRPGNRQKPRSITPISPIPPMIAGLTGWLAGAEPST